MFKKTLLTTALIAAGLSANAQTTAIPDPAFEKALIDLAIDSDGIVNGQLLTTDALTVTNLTIISPEVNNETQYITNLTGLEAFINLENLTVNSTMATTLNVRIFPLLKRLNCVDNMLTSLDVSNNPLLEYLDITSAGDVYPMNEIRSIDLSNNPNINRLIAIGSFNTINLRNGNNNPNMYIDVSAMVMLDEDFINGHTCIEVDDATAAVNNEGPYSGWTVRHRNQSYSFVASCLAGTEDHALKTTIVYPNPASNILHIKQHGTPVIDKAVLYDISGREVREFTTISEEGISVSNLEKGIYILKIGTGKETQNKKIIIE